MNRKKIFTAIFMLICAANVAAQTTLKVEDALSHYGSVPVSECQTFDNGNKRGAKIIIELPVPGVVITNKDVILGDVEHETGRYEVFVKTNNKKSKNYVMVTDGNGTPLKLSLDVDGGGIKGGEAYRVKIVREHAAEAPTAGIEVNSIPTGAEVFVDGQSIGITPCSEIVYANENHLLSLKKDGYMITDTVFNPAKNDLLALNMRMKDGVTRLKMKSDTKDASFTIDGGSQRLIPYNGELAYGPHTLVINSTFKDKWGVMKNYKPLSLNLVAEKGVDFIREHVQFNGTAQFDIDTPGRVPKTKIIPLENANADGYGTHRGNSVNFGKLYGDYLVEIRSAGAKTLTDTVRIASGQDFSQNYVLKLSDETKDIITFRPMLRSLLGVSFGMIRKNSYWGGYMAFGGNPALKEKKEGESRGPESYPFGVRSGYGVIGAIYNPNTWLYLQLGAGVGEYESAGFYLSGSNDTHKDSMFEPTDEKISGPCVEASINFSVGPVFFGVGYNSFIDLEYSVGDMLTPLESNIFVNIGVKLNL